MKNCNILLCFLLLVTACKPKTDNPIKESGNLVLNGVIANPEQVEGNLNIMGFLVEPDFAGTIAKEGTFALDLPAGFDETTQKAFDLYNSLDDATYKLTMPKGSDMFINIEGLETKGLENNLALAGTYYGFQIFKDGNRNGAIYPASSSEFMLNIIQQKVDNTVKGHYYYFVYAKEALAINGTQEANLLLDEIDDTTYTQTNYYDINIKKGWNVLKYEVSDVIRNDSGATFPKRTSQQSVVLANESLKWLYIKGNKNS